MDDDTQFLMDLNDGKERRPFSAMTDRQLLIELLWHQRRAEGVQ